MLYRAALAEGVSPDDAHPASAEIVEVGWFQPDAIAAMSPESADALAAMVRYEHRSR